LRESGSPCPRRRLHPNQVASRAIAGQDRTAPPADNPLHRRQTVAEQSSSVESANTYRYDGVLSAHGSRSALWPGRWLWQRRQGARGGLHQNQRAPVDNAVAVCSASTRFRYELGDHKGPVCDTLGADRGGGGVSGRWRIIPLSAVDVGMDECAVGTEEQRAVERDRDTVNYLASETSSSF